MKLVVTMEMPSSGDGDAVSEAAATFADRLEFLAERLRDLYFTTGEPVPLRDGNGNRIGEYQLTSEVPS